MSSLQKLAMLIVYTVLIMAATKAALTTKKPAPKFITCNSSDSLGGLSWPVDLTQSLESQRCEVDPHSDKQLLCKHPELEVVCKLP